VRSSSLGILPLLAIAGCGAPPAQRPQSPPVVKVLEAGSEPRQRLTFAPALHLTERVAISQKIRFENHYTNTVLQQGTKSVDWPTVHTHLALEASKGNGDVIVTLTVEDSAAGDDFIDPKIRDVVNREAGRLAGLRVSWHAAPSGAISGVEVASKDRKIEKRLRAVFDAFVHRQIVFPDVALGVGATWQVAERRRIGEAEWNETSTYRLRELTATGALIDVTTTATAQEQTLNAEPNRSTKLISGSATGTGQWRLPLHGIAVVGSAQFTGEQHLSIVNHRLRILSTVKTESFVDVKRIDEPAPAPAEPAVAP